MFFYSSWERKIVFFNIILRFVIDVIVNDISERSTQGDAEVPIGIESATDDPQCYVTVPCLY